MVRTNVYHHADRDLSDYTLGASFQIRIRSLMIAAGDYLYFDDPQIGL